MVVSSEDYLFTLTFSYFKFGSHFITSVLKEEPCLNGSLTDHLIPISYSGGRRYWHSWMQYQLIHRKNKQTCGADTESPDWIKKKKKTSDFVNMKELGFICLSCILSLKSFPSYFTFIFKNRHQAHSLPLCILNLLTALLNDCLTQFPLLQEESVSDLSFMCFSASRNTLIITPWMLPWATWSFPWSMMSLGIKSICAWCFGTVLYYI